MPDDTESFLGVGSDTSDHSPKPAVALASSDLAASLCKRYSDAYTEAHTVVTVGKAIKGVAIFLFILIIISSFIGACNQHYGDSIMFSVAGVIFACIVGIPIYALGILVAAQGQTALATLDTAVNGSRHLKDDDAARILTKRWSL